MPDEFSVRDRGRRQAGFSLLEMIIVIAVLGMALGLVVTRGPMRSQTMEMQAIVNKVAQGLRVALSRAIANNAPVRFTVDIPLHSFSIGSEQPVAVIDKVQIQQVLLNLMRNAAEAMDGSARRELSVSTTRAGRMVEISVSDTGQGLAESGPCKAVRAICDDKTRWDGRRAVGLPHHY